MKIVCSLFCSRAYNLTEGRQSVLSLLLVLLDPLQRDNDLSKLLKETADVAEQIRREVHSMGQFVRQVSYG